MEFQFIEGKNKSLYSVYYPPEGGSIQNSGIVLCNPLGQEAIRTQMLYNTLSLKFARMGFHVLRFDYCGTGDSSGDFHQFSIAEALDDIGLVCQELQDACGLTDLSLFGVRMGGTLSWLYALKSNITSLVLWNAIWKGECYAHEIADHYKKWLSGSFARGKSGPEYGFESFGFGFDWHLTKEINCLNIPKGDIPDCRILILDSEPPKHLEDRPNLTVEPVPLQSFWRSHENESQKRFIPTHEAAFVTNWLQTHVSNA